VLDPDVGGLDDVLDEVESQQIRIGGEALLQLSSRYTLHVKARSLSNNTVYIFSKTV
jgi:hypothetical protein